MCERLVKALQRISRRTAATSFYMRITRPTWSPSIRTARMQHGIMPCKGEIIERSQLKLFQSKCVCSSCAVRASLVQFCQPSSFKNIPALAICSLLGDTWSCSAERWPRCLDAYAHTVAHQPGHDTVAGGSCCTDVLQRWGQNQRCSWRTWNVRLFGDPGLLLLLLLLLPPKPVSEVLLLKLPLRSAEGPEIRGRLAARSDGENACCRRPESDAAGKTFQRPTFLWHSLHNSMVCFGFDSLPVAVAVSVHSHPNRDNATRTRTAALRFRWYL